MFYFSYSNSIVLHLFLFMAMTINRQFCGCTRPPGTQNQPGAWALEMLLCLDQILALFGIVISLYSIQEPGNISPILANLVQLLPIAPQTRGRWCSAIFNFVSWTSWSATHHSESYLFTIGQTFNPSSMNHLELREFVLTLSNNVPWFIGIRRWPSASC